MEAIEQILLATTTIIIGIMAKMYNELLLEILTLILVALFIKRQESTMRNLLLILVTVFALTACKTELLYSNANPVHIAGTEGKTIIVSYSSKSLNIEYNADLQVTEILSRETYTTTLHVYGDNGFESHIDIERQESYAIINAERYYDDDEGIVHYDIRQ